MIKKTPHWQLAMRYLINALFLRCPLCGQSPLFIPLRKTRSLYNWLMPLDGCPRCGYAYEREPGYFLLAIWAINYGFGSILGLAIYFFLEWKYPNMDILKVLALVISPIIFFNVFFVRHSKALFLALDLFFDPLEKKENDGNNGGNLPLTPVVPIIPEKGHAPSPLVSKPERELVNK